MRILLWHGYLLGGTGSNDYARELAREWSSAGHDVTLFCQEPHAKHYNVGSAEVVCPDVGGLLPVFVLDRYPRHEAKLLHECSRAELGRWAEANAFALRSRLPADLVFTNHALMGGPVGAASGARYVVKVHGSELEYSLRGRPDLAAWARESLAGAAATVVGSPHVRTALREVCGPLRNVHQIAPGVDIGTWVPMGRDAALSALIAESQRDPPNQGGGDERLPDEGNAERFSAFLGTDEPTVVYFGKLIPGKGVDVLLRAMRTVDARLVVAGFGPQRKYLEVEAPPRTLFAGQLEHRHLTKLLALADACVVPSVRPEAFGMVAAEAAATGCPPLVARHSGLLAIAERLEESYPERLRHLTSFRQSDVAELSDKLSQLLSLDVQTRSALREAARHAVVEHWAWTNVASDLLELGAGVRRIGLG